MRSYLKMLQRILEDGTVVTDRTGTGTICLYGGEMRFDLSEGFPLLTTKKVHLKSIIHELIWILSGNTGTKYLEDNGVSIWREWERPFNSLGAVYGHMGRYAPAFESDDIVKIKIREDKDSNFKQTIPKLQPEIECDLNTDEMWAISREGGKNTIYTVQHISGFIHKINRSNWKSLKSPSKVDGYNKNLFGVGYTGSPRWVSPRLRTLWYNMIARCYNTDHPQYENYGAKGVTVSPIWHSYENFQETISQVPFFYLWERDIPYSVDIDKDYFGSKVYSPSTCIFLPSILNCNMHDKAVSINGKVYASWGHFEKLTGHRADYLKSRFDAGFDTRYAKNSDIHYVQTEDGYVLRKRMYVDQVQNLIDEIRKNPDSRRLLVNHWVPCALNDMALPPCHMLFQVRIIGQKLHLRVDQRSADYFLGVPFNIASYALLTMMLAQVTGYEPGELTFHFGDMHIYLNHMDQVKEQLSRSPRARPTMRLNSAVTDLFNFRYEDFTLEGYDPHPAIKAPVAV